MAVVVKSSREALLAFEEAAKAWLFDGFRSKSKGNRAINIGKPSKFIQHVQVCQARAEGKGDFVEKAGPPS